MKRLLFFLFAFLSLKGTSQDDTTRVLLKVFNNTSFQKQQFLEPGPGGTLMSTEIAELKFFRPTFAVSLVSGTKFFHEVEISSLSLGRSRNQWAVIDPALSQTITVSSSSSIGASAAIKYSFNFFISTPARRTRAVIGAATTPSFSYFRSDPLISSVFRTTVLSAGISAEIIPRLLIRTGKRTSLDLNVPFIISSFTSGWRRVDSPTIPEQQRINSFRELTQLPLQFTFKAGFVVAV